MGFACGGHGLHLGPEAAKSVDPFIDRGCVLKALIKPPRNGLAKQMCGRGILSLHGRPYLTTFFRALWPALCVSRRQGASCVSQIPRCREIAACTSIATIGVISAATMPSTKRAGCDRGCQNRPRTSYVANISAINPIALTSPNTIIMTRIS